MARIPSAGAALSLQIARHDGEGPQGGPAQGAGRRRNAGLGGGTCRARRERPARRPEIVHETLMCLLKTREDKARFKPRSHAANVGEGRMSCCGTPPTLDEMDEVSRLVSRKACGFPATLRDNAFAVGLREGQDAAALIASGYARQARLLRSAFKHLFSARKADWEKFDGLFDAFWLGQRVRSRSAALGSPPAPGQPVGQEPAETRRPGCRQAAPRPDSRRRRARRRGARRRRPHGRRLSGGKSRRDGFPQDRRSRRRSRRRMPSRRGWPRTMRTRLTRRDLARRRGYRLDLRRTIHHNISHGGVPISLVKRQRKEKPLRLVMLLDASGSMSMYTSGLPALHPRRARRVPLGRSIPFPYAAGPCLRRDEGEATHSARSTGCR